MNKSSVLFSIGEKSYYYLGTDTTGKLKPYLEKTLGPEWDKPDQKSLFVTLGVMTVAFVFIPTAWKELNLACMFIAGSFIIYKNAQKHKKLAKQPARPANINYAARALVVSFVIPELGHSL